jgi:hypothetical protein
MSTLETYVFLRAVQSCRRANNFALTNMTTDGERFIQSGSRSNFRGFEQRFSAVSSQFGLGARLSPGELDLLHYTAFRAALCNIALNALGGCGGQIKPERENHRRSLETKFMRALTALHASQGWKALTPSIRGRVESRLLTVRIADRNLAK